MADLRDYAKDNPQRNISLGFHLGDTQKVSVRNQINFKLRKVE